MAQRPPIGSCWRILVQEPHLAAESGNYTALNERATEFEQGGVFDELVIVFEPDPEESGPPSNQQKCELPPPGADGHPQLVSGNWRPEFNLHVRENSGALEVTLYDGQTHEI
jgi:hypothetical protein